MHDKEVHIISTGQQSVDTLAQIIVKIDLLITAVHIREKSWQSTNFISFFQELQKAGINRKKVIINGIQSEGILTRAGGIHLPEREMMHILNLKKHNPTLSISCSVHSLTAAKQAEALGADRLIYGHIFKTQSKPDLAPRGLEKLAKICSGVALPVIAIGGITSENTACVIETGAAGIAVLSGILLAQDPVRAAGEYIAVFE